jgi:PKD repeat protein
MAASPAAFAHPAMASAHPGVLGLSLTSVPSGGTAPLMVDLRATVDPSSESGAFDWAFGDGSTDNSTATGYSALDHDYAAAGTYDASVFVQSSDGDANASLVIQVVASTLAARISATPTSGAAPLTVQFQTEPTGGTGTYTSFVWSFGDGDNGSGADLGYTYTKTGTYTATVMVVDSSGANATTSVQIIVSGGLGAVPPAQPASTPGYAEFVVPIFAVLAVAAVVAILYLAVVVRRTERSAVAPTTPDGALLSPAAAGSAAVLGPSSPEEMAGASASRPGAEDTRSLSERILVHLYWYGRAKIDGVARVDSSQAGMARRLGVAQNSSSKALRRLVDAGAVRAELQHVPGAPRRLKTYSLTARGEAVARRIRAEDGQRPRL